MAEANDTIDTSAQSSLPTDAADVRDAIEGVETWRRHDEEGDDTEELRYVAFPLPCHLLPSLRS